MIIKKIQCACGSGLGSSFLVEMNVKKVLNKLGIKGIEVEHSAATDVFKGSADLFVCGKDMYDVLSKFGPCITLTNIISLPELEEKLSAFLKEKGVI
ncbi:PTS system ascorbate-specific IIB component [Anaerosolibacter carboniphilus]|uniref:PTS system ascorbate-specific IIB component n=1 Tax=Anaerosolibacter carboniphilus TaxID=1417629 RepID=A0A841KTL7_9FIRM|nr:PTS sugar transporter subunit IIB [Anaerosolibacter carboniphilus]MBB6215370.1 PTS system ascorbate-specific IIB component [Anaerosolibacter carboniphilus]